MNSFFFDHLKKFNTNPYFFIGSGLSRRYIALPTWEQLLRNFFVTTGITEEFEYFQSMSHGDLPLLATNISKAFFEIWWKNEKYKGSRESFKVLAKEGKDMPFKIEVADFVKASQVENQKYKSEMALLKKCVVDGIITTNWDTFLEESFNDFNIYIGQQELLFTEAISIGEIYKIHGCVTNPSSLVVTQEDYADFNDRNAYLAAKLLTIFVEHPIIFIGYSISDTNILEIIGSIIKCVDKKNIDKLKDRLIFVDWAAGKEFEFKDSTLFLPENKVLPIKLITTDSFEPLFDTLSTLKRQIPVKLLRKLKDSVVEFVKSNNATSQIIVKDLDKINDDTTVEYAIGIGLSTTLSTQGYKGIGVMDIIEDILFDNKGLDAKVLIETTFPSLIKGSAYMPIYKYLNKSGYLNPDCTVNQTKFALLQKKFPIKANSPKCFMEQSYKNRTADIRKNHKDVNSIVGNYDTFHAMVYIPLLDIASIDPTQLIIFLRGTFKSLPNPNVTAFKKLVCLYDFIATCDALAKGNRSGEVASAPVSGK